MSKHESFIGRVVYRDSDGNLKLYRPYTRFEKFVRSAGIVLRIKRLASYHNRVPVGISTGYNSYIVRGAIVGQIENVKYSHRGKDEN